MESKMKIAIATDDFLTVTGHIGRCNGFIIYDIIDNEIKNRMQVENNFTNHRMGEHHHNHEHGQSHSHSNLIGALSGCSNLICTAAGWRVVEDLKSNGIDVVFTNEENADAVALKFAAGTLEINEDGTCRTH